MVWVEMGVVGVSGMEGCAWLTTWNSEIQYRPGSGNGDMEV